MGNNSNLRKNGAIQSEMSPSIVQRQDSEIDLTSEESKSPIEKGGMNLVASTEGGASQRVTLR